MPALNLLNRIKSALPFIDSLTHINDVGAALKQSAINSELSIDLAYDVWSSWSHGDQKTWNNLTPSSDIEYVFRTAESFGWIEDDHYQQSIATSKDISQIDNRLLDLPEKVFLPSLISLGANAAMGMSGITIKQYIYPSVMSHIMAVLAGRICVNGVHPSCCFVKIGGTSTGKTQTDKAVSEIVGRRFNSIVRDKDTGKDEMESIIHGPTDIASGPAIMRAVNRKERCLMIFDEITSLFSSGAKGGRDPITASKIDAFLVLMTSAGHNKRKSYSDGSKDIKLSYPVVNILGNATPEIFNEFSLNDMRTGLIQRADFFCFSGPTPYWNDKQKTSDELADKFVERLHGIYLFDKPMGRYDLRLDSAIDIGMDKESAIIMRNFSNANIDEMNKYDDEGHKGIISRRYDAALKFALGHVGATRTGGEIYEPITRKDVEYGIMMATMLAKWKLEVLVENINLGEFDNLCKIFLSGVKSAVKANMKPTGKIIVSRRPQLKNITPRQWNDIVQVLKARKEIAVDDSGKHTIYHFLKGE